MSFCQLPGIDGGGETMIELVDDGDEIMLEHIDMVVIS